ncbi:glutamate-1-semialdehyde 2,1-aminomutase domain protein [Mycobacterium xenopi 4042]|uniref:Glutamate-1-semialdehyde 2,1-aminomutase domain protein n=1 Tax=Mycobacterium xenopi 4042 TaxID=1299334 RepID=X8DCS4_MYCXE|nr:glutamate-1-semialdehyde 2,1-aminomutase domain protein [Mycobacterium xenopi 4042]
MLFDAACAVIPGGVNSRCGRSPRWAAPRFITQASAAGSPTPTATAMSTWSAPGPDDPRPRHPRWSTLCRKPPPTGCRSAATPAETSWPPRSSAGWHRWSRSAWSTPDRGHDERGPPGPRLHRPRQDRQVRRLLPRPRRRVAADAAPE